MSVDFGSHCVPKFGYDDAIFSCTQVFSCHSRSNRACQRSRNGPLGFMLSYLFTSGPCCCWPRVPSCPITWQIRRGTPGVSCTAPFSAWDIARYNSSWVRFLLKPPPIMMPVLPAPAPAPVHPRYLVSHFGCLFWGRLLPQWDFCCCCCGCLK